MKTTDPASEAPCVLLDSSWPVMMENFEGDESQTSDILRTRRYKIRRTQETHFPFDVICIYLCMYVCVYNVCMHACMYMYVCMYVCMRL